MPRFSGWFLANACFLLALEAASFKCVAQNENPQVNPRIDANQLRNMLRVPGGLATAAKLYGSITISDPQEFWGSETLDSLTDTSSLILTGTIVKIEPLLSSDGDTINSKYSLRPIQMLKGQSSGDVAFLSPGGKLEFPSGGTADVQTLESGHLKKGDRILVFLRNEGKDIVVTGFAEGIFQVASSGIVEHSVAAFDARQHSIDKEIANSPIDWLTSRINERISAKKD